ncbi:deoxynucleoside kinase [Candidatus Woesearchaeota archaeon]|nr:deoxynucleoside kinase [Candidatus Woesearchaeota archaeon]
MAISGGIAGIMGNIGAGKSTLANFLQSKRGLEILREHIPEKIPIRIINEPTDPYARKAFYSDREKYTDRFEISQAHLRILRHIFANRFNLDDKTKKEEPGIVIFDRTLIEGYSIFGLNSFDDGFLTHRGLEEYNDLIRNACDELGRNFPRECSWLESTLFYLEVIDSKILQKRQSERDDVDGSDGGQIPLEYLQKINKRYEDLTINTKEYYKKFGLSDPKIIKLNGSINIREKPEHLEECADKMGKNIWEMVEACSDLSGRYK